MSGFKINDVDIDTYFMPATASGAQTSSTNTGYTTNNTDLSQRFCKYLRGAKRTETGRYTIDGEDFVNFFQNINVPVTDWSALGTGLLTRSFNQNIVFNEFTNELYYSYGPFSVPGHSVEYRLVVWNGINWTIKGTFNNDITCIEIDDSNNLYAVGYFTNVNGVPLNYIAKYNISTSTWSSLTNSTSTSPTTFQPRPGFTAHCFCIAISHRNPNILYVGGFFNSVDNVDSTTNIAKYNVSTSTWSALGTGLNGVCNVIHIDNATGNLYVVGSFTNAGGVPASRIAKYDVSTGLWSALDTGLNGPCSHIVSDSIKNVYACGNFTNAGGVPVNRIAKYDVSTGLWSALGTGLNLRGLSLSLYNNILYVGGEFTTAGGVPASCIAKYDVSTGLWSPLEYGLLIASPSYAQCVSLIARSGYLYAGGNFTTAGSVQANNIARYELSQKWYPLQYGTNRGVYCMTVDSNNDIFIGGSFIKAGLNNSVNYIARWDGSIWNSVGSGVDYIIRSMAVANGIDIYVTGDFNLVNNNIQVAGVAKWNGLNWVGLGNPPGLYNTEGQNIYPATGSIVVINPKNQNEVYVGGYFNTAGVVPANNIAKWNGLSWSALGSGLSGVCSALAFDSNNNLYVGGSFTNAGGVSVNSIAKWDGFNWSALGSGLSTGNEYLPVCNALAFDSSNNLYVGGNFKTAGDVIVNNIAKWNVLTQSWSGLGSGLLMIDANSTYAECTALAFDFNNTNLYIGGSFSTADNIKVKNIVKYKI